MSFVASTDKWPIILDSAGNPLSWGKLYYTQVDTVSVPKAVYSDILRTTAFPGAIVSCGASGRTSAQVFLGVGEYTVIAYRFAGTDPLTAEPQDWVLDNQWKEYGLADPTALRTSVYTTVDTIADLRLVNPDNIPNVRVLGCYAFDDMFPRTYHFVAQPYTPIDNGGTWITGTYPGYWRLAIGDTDVTDCRIFGIFADSGEDQANRIYQMHNAINGSEHPQRIYFPPGVYMLENIGASAYWPCPAVFEHGAQFTTPNSVAITINTAKGTENRSNMAFCASGSTSNISPSFKWGAVVKPRWWHRVVDGADWGRAWECMIACTDIRDTVHVAENIDINTIAPNTSMYNPIYFSGSGSISLNGAGYILTFKGPGSITVAPGCVGPLRGTYRNLFRFVGYHSIRTSWFENPGVPGYSVDMSPLIIAFNNVATYGCKCIFDLPNTLFDSSLPASNASNFVFTSDGGTAYAASGMLVHLPRSEFGSACALQGYGFILGTATYVKNFIKSGATALERSASYHHALYSAINGSGELDLCGRTLEIQDTYNMAFGGPTPRLLIHNGTLKPLGALSVLRVLSGTCTRVSLENLVVVGGNGSSVVATVGGTVTQLYLKNVKYTAEAGVLSSAMVRCWGGSFDKVNLHNSHCVASHVVKTLAGELYGLNISNCSYLEGDLAVDNCCILANNNKIATIAGADHTWSFSCYESAVITGNRFYQTGLDIKDNGAGIDAVVYGNQFENTDAIRTEVKFIARTPLTQFMGANVYGNSFTGALTTDHVVITRGVEGTGAFADKTAVAKYHRMCLTANQGGDDHTLVPLTRGTPAKGRSHVSVGDGMSQYQTSVDLVVLSANPCIFFIPNSYDAGTVHSVDADRNRLNGDTRVQRSMAWSGGLFYNPLTGYSSAGVRYLPSSAVDGFLGDKRSEITIDLY